MKKGIELRIGNFEVSIFISTHNISRPLSHKRDACAGLGRTKFAEERSIWFCPSLRGCRARNELRREFLLLLSVQKKGQRTVSFLIFKTIASNASYKLAQQLHPKIRHQKTKSVWEKENHHCKYQNYIIPQISKPILNG